MIDTHSHIYLPDFDEDRAEIVANAQKAGVQKILMPNIDGQSVRSVISVEEEFPGYCYAMMGLHPTSVKGDYLEQLANVEYWLRQQDFLAIGEIGIDLYWDKTWEREQREVFRTQLNWAKKMGKPVVIHVRDAFEAVFQELDKVHDGSLKGVFHSFSGNKSQARRAVEYQGFMLGINGIVTFKNSNLDKVLTEMGPEKLMIETDAPYLAPVPYRGKRNQPAFIKHTLEKLAAIFDMTPREMDELTTRNAAQLFGLDVQ
ncbi:TatD family hydrolase [Marinilabilia rubra]|uniref:Hydrolase TatD n=1 Tax=Marinilabilia rubra TaxID=2162893 RepID=A0A2U2B3M0_9BACT|nr:TatD family hydrolase [Marinilabilia rubra]PWD97644.1 hydrolase TatD [Marinilabilia rubra]